MMSSLDQRILLYTAATATWTDYTYQLNDPTNGLTVDFSMLPADFIYIGTFLPFNHKYFKVTTPTALTRPVKIEVNDLSNWYQVADYLDHTQNMQLKGNMQFTRDRDATWGRAMNNKRDVFGMSTAPTQVYDMYWTRISFPAVGSPPPALAFSLNYIGQCFSTDTDLFAQYPALRSAALMTSWQTGKADWIEQHILSSGYIAKTLRQRKIIVTSDQLLDIATLVSPSVHKVAEIAYSGLGAKNYEKEIAMASARFEKAMTMDQFQVDEDADGIKGVSDRKATTSRATR